MNFPYKMTIRFLTILLVFSATLLSCSNQNENRQAAALQTEIDNNLPLAEQIDLYINQDRYDEALEILSTEDREEENIRLQLERTHLNYALHSMNTFDETEMRTRMNNALYHFTEVLKINPENQIAREQIQQIMMIYSTIPDREPEPDVLEGLRELGLDY